MFEGQRVPTELTFKGSECDHEVLGVLETEKPQMRPNLLQNGQFWGDF